MERDRGRQRERDEDLRPIREDIYAQTYSHAYIETWVMIKETVTYLGKR